ncbi:23S ribosomal RNA methyltransferase Erm [Agromyces soli]|uniref:23S ribosomal RNA methyltransferase Erm n=1 Tax=Agromyces soli TaxID=659012 RepID=A0ABY4AW79_9MICO|nr:23S ribosomal RNA methyltransferase Erm [Agromyces soli]UOE27446.1 23S ribosomal RNA methyltransferase Erm [Agromyces soli]
MPSSKSPSSRAHSRAQPRSLRSQPHGGRHELGQNFLVDRRVVAEIVELARTSRNPIVELGPGGGALTRPLAELGRPLTAVELDPSRVARLQRELGPHVEIVQADLLRWSLPRHPHLVVANLPFHLTTAALRHLLDSPGWEQAVLLTQWEVARRRCGVGGASMLTVQWAPWYRFRLRRRVPASAFRPIPSVDGGLFTIERRERPLVDLPAQRSYQRFVGEAFQGRGAGLAQRLAAAAAATGSAGATSSAAKAWLRRRGIPPSTPPGRLSPDDWAALWDASRGRG